MGIYFITDPDGYWLEILPPKNKNKRYYFEAALPNLVFKISRSLYFNSPILNVDIIYKKNVRLIIEMNHQERLRTGPLRSQQPTLIIVWC